MVDMRIQGSSLGLVDAKQDCVLGWRLTFNFNLKSHHSEIHFTVNMVLIMPTEILDTDISAISTLFL